MSRFVCSAIFLVWLHLCLRSSHGWSGGRWRHRLPNHKHILLSHRSAPEAISAASDANTTEIPATMAAAGIPRELEELALFGSLECDGKEPNQGSLESSNNQRRTIERVSIDPPIFILRNAISPCECGQIQAVALSMNTEMEAGKTVIVAEAANAKVNAATVEEATNLSPRKSLRKHSKVGWVENNRSFIQAIARRAHGVFLNGMPFHATGGIEPLQVVHYHGEGGEYVNHHDGKGRLLTVLYYLNGVGETWFPLADDSSSAEECGTKTKIHNLEEARHACIVKSPDRDGVLVTCRTREEHIDTNNTGSIVARVNEGDAVAFYNYREDGSVNWKSFHSGLPITKDDMTVGKDNEGQIQNTSGKWIANHFYHFVPSDIPETTPPRRAASTIVSSSVETQ
jgi:hypothetical protein